MAGGKAGVGEIQPMQDGLTGTHGFGFVLTVRGGQPCMSFCYATQEEAEIAAKNIKTALANTIFVKSD